MLSGTGIVCDPLILPVALQNELDVGSTLN
jgi:hypothetical protein